MFLSLHILCAILGASFYFAFSLFWFVFWSYTLLDHSFLVWERDTLRFFIRILLCFAYILLSILSCCLFASKLSLLAFILLGATSFFCSNHSLAALIFVWRVVWNYLVLGWCVRTIECRACGSGMMKNCIVLSIMVVIIWYLSIVLRY